MRVSASNRPTRLEGATREHRRLQRHAAGYQRDVFQESRREAGGGSRSSGRTRRDSTRCRSGSLSRRAPCAARCHAASGGGRNFKRGDLEYVLVDTDRDYDVHMGKDGANMQCVHCHAGEDHRVRGRGADLSATDMPKKPLMRHGRVPRPVSPHGQSTEQACRARRLRELPHPELARTDATDMARDWSKPKYNPRRGQRQRDDHARQGRHAGLCMVERALGGDASRRARTDSFRRDGRHVRPARGSLRPEGPPLSVQASQGKASSSHGGRTGSLRSTSRSSSPTENWTKP